MLVAGGGSTVAEVYNPQTGRWRRVGAMSVERYGATATLLRDGHVLVAGGFAHGALATAELYNPETGRWSAAGRMVTARFDQQAILLADGRAMIIGGARGNGPTDALASTEIFDPVQRRWRRGLLLNDARARFTATMLRGGSVLVAGGIGQGPGFYLATSELLQP